MKSKIILSLMLIFSVFAIGCGGGNGKKDPRVSFNPARNYVIDVTVTDEGAESKVASLFATEEITVAKNSISPDPSWYKEKSEKDGFLFNWRTEQGSRRAHGGLWATLRDADTGEIVDLTPTQANQFTWTLDDYTDVSLNTSLGSSILLDVMQPKAVGYTVAYKYDVQVQDTDPDTGEPIIRIEERQISASGRIVVIDYEVIPVATDQGFNFEARAVSTLADSDFWYSREDGVNYINAPGGASMVLGPTVFEELGGILREPTGLSYATKLPCTHYGAYIVKTRSGKLVKLLSSLDNSARSNAAIFFTPPVDGPEFDISY